jgi:peptidoglycan/xylan/chitin deacetylase (PgdA/CDA1 family)
MGRALAFAGMTTAALQVGPAGSWLPALRPASLRGLGDPASLALTFDDGPDPAGTPAVLQALDRLRWPATFFLLGQQVRRDRGLCREIARRGHEIALHGDDHRYLIARPPRAAYEDMARGRDTVEEATGTAPIWWRPPYGVLSGPALVAARRLGLRPMIWTSWGRDWRPGLTPAEVADTVMGRPLAGATVLLHDSDLMSSRGSWRTTVAALPLLADAATAGGLAARTLSMHLAAAA